jgi:hypothetical protein
MTFSNQLKIPQHPRTDTHLQKNTNIACLSCTHYERDDPLGVVTKDVRLQWRAMQQVLVVLNGSRNRSSPFEFSHFFPFNPFHTEKRGAKRPVLDIEGEGRARDTH